MSGKQCRQSLKRICCPCCMYSGMRAYLRILEEGRCPVTHQLLQNVEAFDTFECIKFLYILQRDQTSDVWIPSICSRLLALYYDDPDDVEAYLPQICRLLLAFERPCTPLEVAVLHLCSRSLHFSLHVWWFLIGEIEDCRTSGMYSRAANLLLCVFAAVEERANSKGIPGFKSQNAYLARLLENSHGDRLKDITTAIQTLAPIEAPNTQYPGTPAHASMGIQSISATPAAAAGGEGRAVASSMATPPPPAGGVPPRGERSSSSSSGDDAQVGGVGGESVDAVTGLSGDGLSSEGGMGSEGRVASAVPMGLLHGGGGSGALGGSRQRKGHVRAPSEGGGAAAVSQEGEVAADQGKEQLLNWVRTQCMEGRGFFQEEAAFVTRLTDIAELLRMEAPCNRQDVLNQMVQGLNERLSHKKTCHFGLPFRNSSDTFRRVVRISPEYAKVFSTAMRCPFMIAVESIATIRKCSAPDLDPVQRLKRFSKEIEFKTQVVRDGLMPKISFPRSLNVASSMRAPLLDQEGQEREEEGGGGGGKGRSHDASAVGASSWNDPMALGTGWLHSKLPTPSPPFSHAQRALSDGASSLPTLQLSSEAGAGPREARKRTSPAQRRLLGDQQEVNTTALSRGEAEKGASPKLPDKGSPFAEGEDPLAVSFVTMGAFTMEEEEEDPSPLQPPSEDILRGLQAGSRIGISAMDATVGASPAGTRRRERWEHQKARIKMGSPFARQRGWDVETVIVKSFDDVRQEALAMQLFEQIAAIWKHKNVPVKVFPYKIIPTSSTAGLIQGITDALSLDFIKKQPSYKSLLAHFHASFGGPRSDTFRQAQANFARSLAGYSILSYVLQVKDRHNGNLLLGSEGHLMHIDFAFILGMSPGNLNFERAPFKLTDEYIEVLGGKGSPAYSKFQRLCVQAFLEVRANHHKIAALVEIMMARSSLPCFKGPRSARILDALMSRMELGLSTQGCEARVLELVEASAGSWATKQYDHYQKMVNGIEA